jgi:hypothetical protein
MKQSDQTLRRLLAAAAQAPEERRESPPFGFETAILAGWRAKREEGEFALLLRIFRGAMIAAVAVMTLTGVWSRIEAPVGGDATALARYALMQLPP